MTLEKKEQSILKIHDEPVLPKLTRIMFWMMVILLAAMLLVDLNAFIRYDYGLGMRHLFKNLAVTGFYEWSIFSVIVLSLCLLGCIQNRRRFLRNKMESGLISNSEEEIQRDRRAVKKLNESYFIYTRVCVAGAFIWLVLFIVLATG